MAVAVVDRWSSNQSGQERQLQLCPGIVHVTRFRRSVATTFSEDLLHANCSDPL